MGVLDAPEIPLLWTLFYSLDWVDMEVARLYGGSFSSTSSINTSMHAKELGTSIGSC